MEKKLIKTLTEHCYNQTQNKTVNKEFVSHVLKCFDKKSNLLKEIYYDENQKLDKKTIIIYDCNNNSIDEKTYNKKEELDSHYFISNKYDMHNNLIERTIKSIDGNYNNTTKFNYDDNNNVIESLIDGATIVYSYKNNKLIKLVNQTEFEKTIHNYKYINEILTEENYTSFTSSGLELFSSKTIYLYDGTLFETKEFFKDEVIIISKYNKNGSIISIDDYSVNINEIYLYNQYNNLIKKTSIFKDTKSKCVVEYLIEYY